MSSKNWLHRAGRALIVEALADRDGARCYYCRTSFPEGLAGVGIDHYIPYQAWPEHVFRNLVLCCAACQGAKQDRLPYTVAAILLAAATPAELEEAARANEATNEARAERLALARELKKQRRAGKPSGDDLRALKDQLAERHGGCCFYCRRGFTDELPSTLDHYVPHRLWPGWAPENLVLACEPCNLAKSGVLPPVMARLLLSLAA